MEEVLPFRIHEEIVVEIEADASTQTEEIDPNPIPSKFNAMKKGKYELKSSNSQIIDYLYRREMGCKLGSKTTLNASAIETKHLSPKHYLLTTHNELHNAECKYLRGGLDGHSVIGLWVGDQFNYIMYRLELKLGLKCSTRTDDVPKAITNIERQGPYFTQTHLIDICDTYVGQQNFLLYVGNKFPNNTVSNYSVVCTFASTSPTAGKEYISRRDFLCCGGNLNKNIFAVGTNEGVYIYENYNCVFNEDYPSHINSVEFDSLGNVLICGCDSPGLIIYDLREHNHASYNVPIKNLSPLGISETKLLYDETTLVVSGKDGSLSKIDLRMKSTVLNYPGHVGSNKKIPFSVSESADLVCATGTDNLTRLWSLNTGELLHSIHPRMVSTNVHSSLIRNGLRWAVAILQKNRMYIMEPWA